MARRVDLRSVAEGAVFVFNPLPWPRKALLEYHTEQNPSDNAPITHLAAPDGTKVPLQWRPAASMTQFWPRLSAWVDVPACGYTVYELAHGEAPTAQPYSTSFVVNERGFGVSSVKSDGAELLRAPVALVVIADSSDTWAHGVASFRDEIGRPTLESATVVEDGPVTRVTRQRSRWRNSEIVLDIAQYAAMDIAELRFVIDWHEREQMLKLELPTALANPRVFAKVPGAAIERKANGEEEPYQDWIAVQGETGGAQHVIALINDGSYSYDCLGPLLRTVLIRSAPFARHNPWKVPPNDNNAWQDQGRQERRFWLVRGKGPWTSLNLDRLASELQTPAEYVIDSAHEGSQPRTQSNFEIMLASLEVLAFKRAEDGSGLIVRLQERAGNHTQARLRSGSFKLDHAVALRAWELKTLIIAPDGRVREVDLLEQ
jgi:alpha-mannosidase